MDKENKVLDYAIKLEGILRRYLQCDYTEFGVKANDNLIKYDWKSPINFALGYRYASSEKDPEVKKKIDNFLGNEFEGQSIGEILEKYEYYGYDSKDAALEYVQKVIDDLEKILFPNETE